MMTPSGEMAAGAVLARMFELGVRLTQAMDQGLGEQGLSRSRAEVIWRLHHLAPVTQLEASPLSTGALAVTYKLASANGESIAFPDAAARQT